MRLSGLHSPCYIVGFYIHLVQTAFAVGVAKYIGKDKAGIEFLAKCGVDGIISTKEIAKKNGAVTFGAGLNDTEASMGGKTLPCGLEVKTIHYSILSVSNSWMLVTPLNTRLLQEFHKVTIPFSLAIS